MTATSPASTRPRIWPLRPLRAAIIMVGFLAVLWIVEALDVFVFGGDPDGRVVNGLDVDGIIPRSVDGLDGILWAPLLHLGWEHLEANSLPLLVLGFFVLANGIGQFVAVTALVWVLDGVMVWLTGTGLTVGASGVIFGWLAFLLVRGFLARPRAWGQIALAVVLFLVYGGVLWGLLPGTPGVSWQAHLFGALAGVLAAWLTAAADRRSRPATPPDQVPPSPTRP